eukprot:TRINITY_DN10935_c0_g1_i1.p1 TRINITY_DN10935_c0_g1~~TRINITY_DN10935_c0_g1_i1.p1  ORF type:complete len:340 (+),score=43.88 TRINITY_DN10935_c0_g1_i1:37-1056(+)
MSSSDRRCSQCFCCAAGDDDIATENLARAELPDAWSQMLGDGHVLSSLLLATVYSEKYRGRNMHPDETAQLALPIGPEEGNNRESSATLLHRTYSKENAAFIWRCNELDAKVVYIAFNPLRKNVQFVRLLKNVALGAVLVNHEMPLPVPDTGGLTVRRSRPVKMMRYISQKVESLYVKHEFSRMLDDTLSRFPDHRMIFTGISHGATLAQAAALRASMRYPDRQFHIATKLAMIVAFGESQRFRSASQGSAAFGAEDVVAPLGSEIQSSLYSEDRQSGLPPRAARQTCPAYLSGQQRVADDFDDMVHSCYGAPRRSSSGLSKSRSDSAPTHPLRRSETG